MYEDEPRNGNGSDDLVDSPTQEWRQYEEESFGIEKGIRSDEPSITPGSSPEPSTTDGDDRDE